MSKMDWGIVAVHLEDVLSAMNESANGKPCFGQEHAARALARRLKNGGAILADEVGLGKTRVALAIMEAVMRAGGTVAAVVPPGLIYQWESEAKEFIDSIESGTQGKCVTKSPMKLRSYWGIFGEASTYPLIKSKIGKWLLVSHNFGFLNRVQKNTELWKFELPILVRSYIAQAKQEHGNSIWLRYLSRVFEPRPGMRSWQSSINSEREWNERMQSAAQYLAGRLSSFSRQTKNFLMDEMVAPIDRDGNPLPNASEAFQRYGCGRKALHELIGHTLGKIDLLIIDEAHKSREELADNGSARGAFKRLTTLIEEIVQLSDNSSRRLCLTATPVELGASQWKELLQRAQVSDVDFNCLVEFEKALHAVNMAPDDPHALDQVEAAARIFESNLRPVMVRRRRINQPEHRELLPATNTAHPHRAMSTLLIDINDLDCSWRKAAIALEGMSLAATGTQVDNGAKMVRYRYASGMLDLSARIGEEHTEQKSEKQPSRESAKQNRVNFWHRLALVHVAGNSTDEWDGTNHPRVQKTADFIESILRKKPDEKFLVFGTFTKPMRGIVQELNARYVVRRLVGGRPTLAMRVSSDGLWHAYLRLANRKDDLGLGTDSHPRLTFSSAADLRKALQRAQMDYDNLQARLARWFGEDDLVAKLPGDNCLRRMKDEDGSNHRLKAVLQHLRSELLEEMLEGPSISHYLSEPSAAELELADDGRKELTRRLIEIWSDYVRGAYDQNLAAEQQMSTEWDGDDELKEVDQIGDQISPEHLLAAMDLSVSSESMTQRGGFCRLMDGSMAMSTRRIVQERFNRQGSMPRVLVAQSLVGREGLNLHRACRRVVLFHPEWNPAIVEQEIGRVDRIRSLWNKMATEWKENSGDLNTYPKIECTFVVFKGTYDEWQFWTLENRRRSLEAQLFGAMLDEEAFVKLEKNDRERMAKAAPDFEPSRPDLSSVALPFNAQSNIALTNASTGSL